MLADQPLCDAKTVLQIGEWIAHVPADLGQLSDRQLAGPRREAHDREEIAREARMSQTAKSPARQVW